MGGKLGYLPPGLKSGFYDSPYGFNGAFVPTLYLTLVNYSGLGNF